jgi:hypothetical protein
MILYVTKSNEMISSSSSIILLLDVYDLSLITIPGKGHFLVMNMLTLKKNVL